MSSSCWAQDMWKISKRYVMRAWGDGLLGESSFLRSWAWGSEFESPAPTLNKTKLCIPVCAHNPSFVQGKKTGRPLNLALDSVKDTISQGNTVEYDGAGYLMSFSGLCEFLHPHEKTNVVVHACNSSTWGGGDICVPEVHRLASLL